MTKITVTFDKQIEAATQLQTVLKTLKGKFSETFESSFLQYAGLLADAVSDPQKAKVLAEAQRISTVELQAIKESFGKIEALIAEVLIEAKTECAEQKRVRLQQEAMLSRVDEAIKKYYWG